MKESVSRSHVLRPVDRLLNVLDDDRDFAGRAVTLARAPGRLDVMGGIADYTGSRVCQWPLREAAAAAVARRDDGAIVATSAGYEAAVDVSVSSLDETDPATVRDAVEGRQRWARYPIGCAWWLLRQCGHRGGWTVRLDSDVPAGAGVSSSAAIEVATMHALCGLERIEIEPMVLAAACQYVENHVVGAPCGVMDQATAVAGCESRLLELLCQPDEQGMPARMLGHVPVPSGYRFVGIDSGVTHEVSGDPYTDTRIAAFMGARILGALKAPGADAGWLARVDAAAYEAQFRARLPVAMAGGEFIEAYGDTGDTVTRVDPAKQYSVRDATDHHVREMGRVTRFGDLLREAAADAPIAHESLCEAGRLMLQSHESYGRCAYLGHPLTDALVERVIDAGAEGGLFGARITGGGCGGTVGILMRDDADTFERVRRIQHEYERESGRRTRLFDRSGPGALAWGMHRMEARS